MPILSIHRLILIPGFQRPHITQSIISSNQASIMSIFLKAMEIISTIQYSRGLENFYLWLQLHSIIEIKFGSTKWSSVLNQNPFDKLLSEANSINKNFETSFKRKILVCTGIDPSVQFYVLSSGWFSQIPSIMRLFLGLQIESSFLVTNYIKK